MTEARSNEIAEVLLSNREYGEHKLSISLEQAVAEFEKEGYDFTAEELIEFRQGLVTLLEAQKNGGELDEDALSKVSGGCHRCFVAGEWVAVALVVVAVSMW
jgi:hypothetical protein